MNGGFESFLALPEQDRRDVFEAAAARLDTLPGYVEKDFWVCLVLDALFNRQPEGHPRLLFKGGTSLSKAFALIERFSEDIDLVVFRDGLGFEGERDPTVASGLSNKKRAALFKDLGAACRGYIRGALRTALASRIDELATDCQIVPDESHDGQTLFIEYPTLFPSSEVTYVAPRVKIEAGARSALDPSRECTITPYMANELPGWSFASGGLRVIAPERTYWEKLLILHGVHCGYRDAGRLPADKDRISRHYYDVAVITATEVGQSALVDTDLLDAVRNHNIVAFRQAWKRFEEAVPGSVRLVPQAELRAVIEQDYRAMQGMILGDCPDFRWVTDQLRHAEAAINGT
ncbi:MAG: nucleotidyl transferase AbiEii/AbiGii toxin family protein [Deltaproteobacteria bacterium]|nr:nucleotidyl transferase AbiEii/AbiGii toxin family protein [Deltaproteobacteria bacterium]MDE0342853.1 nucleotidyl transferase AbiEii/AbiGii toxin family protein [Deltaproteobacteria bacterium]